MKNIFCDYKNFEINGRKNNLRNGCEWKDKIEATEPIPLSREQVEKLTLETKQSCYNLAKKKAEDILFGRAEGDHQTAVNNRDLFTTVVGSRGEVKKTVQVNPSKNSDALNKIRDGFNKR